MNNYTRRILTSVFTLVLMVFALGTGVFAWFTMNTKASADGLTGSAKVAEGGLLIRLAGGEWGTSVDLKDVELDDEFAFTDLSTSNGVNLHGLETDDTDYAINKDYIEFTLEFLTGANNNKVSLTDLQFVESANTTWVSEIDITGKAAAGEILESNIVNALRVSFQEGESGTATIFEREAGANDNIPPEGEAGTKFENTNGFGSETTNFAHLYYVGIMGPTPFNTPNRTDLVLEDASEADKVILTTTEGGITHDFDDSYSHYGKVTVRVWIEGWDQEAFNAILGGTATINMSFEADKID